MAAIFRHKKFTYFTMPLNVNGKSINVDFSPGSIELKTKAFLRTNDVDLALALKAKAKESLFIEVEEWDIDEKKATKATPAAKQTTPETKEPAAPKGEIGNTEGSDGGEGASYPEVSTAQAARDLLIKNHGAKAANLKSKSQIIAVAESLNVSFPNLVVE